MPVTKHFSLVFHLFNPIIASLITFFFIFLLQDLLLIKFIFENVEMSIFLFILLTSLMIITSYKIPQQKKEFD